MARIRDEDGLFELTEEDLKKVAKGDDSPFYQMHDTLPEKPLGFKFDECPEECMSNGILPILVSKKCPALYSMIEGMAAVAIQKFFGPDGVHRPIKSIFKVFDGHGVTDAAVSLRNNNILIFMIDEESCFPWCLEKSSRIAFFESCR